MPENLNWNQKEFLAFILLYAANVDSEYTVQEQEMITEVVDQEHYTSVKETFDQMNDTQCLELIQAYKGLYFPTGEQTEELLAKLDSLFEADGDYSRFESAIRSMLHRLL